MGVMLFPSFLLGNASGGGSASFALFSLFFCLSSSSSFLPLLPSFLPLVFSFPAFSSTSLFLLSPLFLPPLFFFSSYHTLFFFFSPYHTPLFSFSPYHTPLFLFPLSRLLLILSFSFVPFLFFFFFLRGLLVLSVYQDVIEDTTDCNRMRFI